MKLKSKIGFCIIAIFLLFTGICNRNTCNNSKIKAETAAFVSESSFADENSSPEDTLTSLVNLFVRCERNFRNRTHKYDRVKLIACSSLFYLAKGGKWTFSPFSSSQQVRICCLAMLPSVTCQNCKVLRI